jgi:DNA (cytosine-5)-methyltransferase 1
MKKSITYIDLFAGAGGLSEGFIRANFNPIAHIDIDKNACLTLKTRIAYHYFLKSGDLGPYVSYLKGEIDRAKLYRLIPKKLLNKVINKPLSDETNNFIYKEINKLLKDNNEESVDVVIGGPPCQAYSVIGRSRDPLRMKDDHRNYLYKYYLDFLNRFKPKLFVFENVRGLLSAGKEQEYIKAIQLGFKNIGYESDFRILNAAHFGVVQNRERVILIGWQNSLKFKYPEFEDIKCKTVIKEIFSDLPDLPPGKKEKIINYSKNISKNHYLYINQIRNGIPFVTQHQTRPHNNQDLEIYKIAIELWVHKGIRLKYNQLPERLRSHKNSKDFLDRFRVVDPEGVCHTIVAHLSKDGHYYIYPSIENPRSISIREAARIQSFPDDYFFEGGQGAAFKQIGNAVPPIMAEKIAKAIFNMIK